MRMLVLAVLVVLSGCYSTRTPAYCAPDATPAGDVCPTDGGYQPCSSGDGGWFHPCEDAATR